MSEQDDIALQMVQWQTELAISHGLNMSERTIHVVGPVNEKMFKSVEAKMTLLEAQSKEPIRLIINSSGGNAYDGHALAGRIRSSSCEVITEGYGAIMSAATLIFAAGHKRRTNKYAIFMVHESSAIFEGKSLEMKEFAKWAVKEEVLYCQMMAELTSTPVTQWNKIISSRHDKYFTAAEAVEMGLAHEQF